MTQITEPFLRLVHLELTSLGKIDEKGSLVINDLQNDMQNILTGGVQRNQLGNTNGRLLGNRSTLLYVERIILVQNLDYLVVQLQSYSFASNNFVGFHASGVDSTGDSKTCDGNSNWCTHDLFNE